MSLPPDATPAHIRGTLTTIRSLTQAVDTRLGATINQLALEAESADGYNALAPGYAPSKHPPFITVGELASTSSTERAAIGPDERNTADTKARGAQAALDEILDYLLTAAQALRIVCDEIDKRTPGLTAIDISRLQCAVIPRGACTQWADPTRNDGYCIDHGRNTDTATRARQALRDRLRYHRNGMRE